MKFKKVLFVVLGCIGVGLGAVGAVLPLVPSFPFLLLAAFSFAKSSERLLHWFISTRLYKNNLESYMKGKGMTQKTKIRVMLTVTVLMSIGFLMMSRVPIGRVVLVCVWVFHILYFIFGVKTLKSEQITEKANSIGENLPAYRVCRKIKVEGMQCENCAKRLECAFNETGYMKAKVDYSTKTATVYLEKAMNNVSLIQIVNRAGYIAEQIWESAT